MSKETSKTKSVVLSGILVTAIILFFSVVYFDNHAWGSWGDDSAGYIYLAGRMQMGLPTIYLDELGAKGLEYFNDEKLARWLIPTHHEFINPDGTVASKYPVGSSLLLLAGSALSGSSKGFYIVTPLLAVFNLVMVYLLALLLFENHQYRQLIGLMSAGMLGITELYYSYAIAQPMREIPSMAFLLLCAVLLLLAFRATKPASRQAAAKQEASIRRAAQWTPYYLFAFAGLSFGMAFNVRETSVMVLPAIAVLMLAKSWERNRSFLNNARQFAMPALIFLAAVSIAALPTVTNSIRITQESAPLIKDADSGVVLLSNIDHASTLSVDHLFHSKGKFRPGRGGVPYYWQVLQEETVIPYFLVFVGLGLILLWRRSKSNALFLALWMAGIYAIFALWINPYSRYILPLFAPLILLGVYGVFELALCILPKLFKQRWLIGVATSVIAVTFFFGLQPRIAAMQSEDEVLVFKSISETDLDQLMAIGNMVDDAEQPLLMFTGSWQFGTSETFEAHTGVKAIKFPYEQRDEFNPEQTNTFLEQLVGDYDFYLWLDPTSSADVITFLEQYETKQVAQMDFSFQPDVSVYKLNTPEEPL